MRAIRRFTVRTALPAPLRPLGLLATNLRWSWHADSRAVFAAVDPVTWEAVGHDPVKLLGAVSTERLAELAKNADFLFEMIVADLHWTSIQIAAVPAVATRSIARSESGAKRYAPIAFPITDCH